jgi:hypothetical protein
VLAVATVPVHLIGLIFLISERDTAWHGLRTERAYSVRHHCLSSQAAALFCSRVFPRRVVSALMLPSPMIPWSALLFISHVPDPAEPVTVLFPVSEVTLCGQDGGRACQSIGTLRKDGQMVVCIVSRPSRATGDLGLLSCLFWVESGTGDQKCVTGGASGLSPWKKLPYDINAP